MSAIPVGIRERISFAWRSFVTGIDEAGRFYNHNRIVGILLVLAILGIGFFPINFALQYRIPAALIAIGLMTLNGAYVESRTRVRQVRTLHSGVLEAPTQEFGTRESAVQSLSEFGGTRCEIVWAQTHRYPGGNAGAEQLAEYLKDLLEEAGWVISSFSGEDIRQASRPGVADNVVTVGYWRLDQEKAFLALSACLTYDLEVTRKRKIGRDFDHPKDKPPCVTVWSRGLPW